MTDGTRTGEDWSDEENDLIVADYFAMLTDALAGRPFNKAAHNRPLQAKTGRSDKSIDFKYCNVSAACTPSRSGRSCFG